MRYLITFTCYGGHLHGSESGSVDRFHSQPGARLLPDDLQREWTAQWVMKQEPYRLDARERAAVLGTLREVCRYRGWSLLAAHVRMTHVHVVVDADAPPERVMNDFKSYASRNLNRLGCDGVDRKRWTRHGSTRWLWTDQEVGNAVRYVVEEQGEPMTLFVAEDFSGLAPLPYGHGSVTVADRVG